jgi:hypothetical protein
MRFLRPGPRAAALGRRDRVDEARVRRGARRCKSRTRGAAGGDRVSVGRGKPDGNPAVEAAARAPVWGARGRSRTILVHIFVLRRNTDGMTGTPSR